MLFVGVARGRGEMSFVMIVLYILHMPVMYVFFTMCVSPLFLVNNNDFYYQYNKDVAGTYH